MVEFERGENGRPRPVQPCAYEVYVLYCILWDFHHHTEKGQAQSCFEFNVTDCGASERLNGHESKTAARGPERTLTLNIGIRVIQFQFEFSLNFPANQLERLGNWLYFKYIYVKQFHQGNVKNVHPSGTVRNSRKFSN